MTRRWLILLALVLAPLGVAAQPLPMGVPDLCATVADRTVVPVGASVALSGTHSCIEVRGTATIPGSLSFVTLLVYPGGTLEKQTPGELVMRDQPIDLGADPEQWGHGLVAFGRVTLRGTPKTSWVRLGADPLAGQTVLTLATPVTGWQVGDELVLPDTRHLTEAERIANTPQVEIRRVASVAADGRSVTLQTPIQWDHRGAKDPGDPATILYRAHVGNLTRDVKLRSENPNGVRGHTVFIDRADATVEHVQFTDLGRTLNTPLHCTVAADGIQAAPPNFTECKYGTQTAPPVTIGTNQIGRYALHFHMLTGPAAPQANGRQFTATGNTFTRSRKWAVAVHSSSYGRVSDSVIYESHGAGLMTEAGNEIENEIDRNFVVQVTGIGGRDTGGREGVGLYLRGTLNRARGNVVATVHGLGSDAHYAYKFFPFYLGNQPIPVAQGSTATQTVDLNAIPITEFADNEGYGAESGLTYWWVCFGVAFDFGPQPPPPCGPSILKNLTIWHVYNKGVFHYPAVNIVQDGLTVIGDYGPGKACCAVGWEGADYLARGAVLTHARIEGMAWGVNPSAITHKPGLPPVPVRIEHSRLRNEVNFAARTLFTSGSNPTEPPPRLVVVENVTRLDWPGHPRTDFRESYLGGGAIDLVEQDRWTIRDGADEWQWFIPQSAPTFVVPQSTPSLNAAPVAGLTNAQLWAQYGLAIGGAVAPCTTTRPFVSGFACVTTVTPPPPLPVDCVVSAWSEWSAWSVWTPQGNGTDTRTRTRTRTVVTPPANGGAPCPPLSETETETRPTPPPPISPVAPTVSMTVKTCTLTATATVSPDGAPGWKAQLQRSADGVTWANHGSASTAYPVTRAATVALGPWSVRTVYTKTGMPTTTSPVTTARCGP